MTDFELHINDRWANEDPNPTAIKAEKAHLKQLGEAGIGKALDPDFIEAVRVMDELENGSSELTTREYDEGDVRAAKRVRREDVEVHEQIEIEQPVKDLESKGILSKNTLDSLKFLTAMKKLPAVAPIVVQASSSLIGGLGGLADYGSDEE